MFDEPRRAAMQDRLQSDFAKWRASDPGCAAMATEDELREARANAESVAWNGRRVAAILERLEADDPKAEKLRDELDKCRAESAVRQRFIAHLEGRLANERKAAGISASANAPNDARVTMPSKPSAGKPTKPTVIAAQRSAEDRAFAAQKRRELEAVAAEQHRQAALAAEEDRKARVRAGWVRAAETNRSRTAVSKPVGNVFATAAANLRARRAYQKG